MVKKEFYKPHFAKAFDMFNCPFHSVIYFFFCSKTTYSKPENRGDTRNRSVLTRHKLA